MASPPGTVEPMTFLEQFQAIGLVAVAMLLGGLVGLERDRAGHAAGIRTNMLVAGAAALVVVLGSAALEATDGTAGDPSRALHAVITGIGFLGGGMILRDGTGGRTSGLTSAASVFIVAAVGAAAGMGEVVLAVGVTALALVTLGGVKALQQRAPRLTGDEHDDPEVAG
jgi:putative Mg2+ transporter-C (MgtC) family protein